MSDLDDTDDHEPSNSLCWSCRNATPLMCAWVRNAVKGQLPEYVEGHVEKVITNQAGSPGSRTSKTVTMKVVTRCRRHEAGRLPPIGRMWPA